MPGLRTSCYPRAAPAATRDCLPRAYNASNGRLTWPRDSCTPSTVKEPGRTRSRARTRRCQARSRSSLTRGSGSVDAGAIPSPSAGTKDGRRLLQDRRRSWHRDGVRFRFREGSRGAARGSPTGTPLDCADDCGIASARRPAALYECSFAYAAAAPQPYCDTRSFSARASGAVLCCFA